MEDIIFMPFTFIYGRHINIDLGYDHVSGNSGRLEDKIIGREIGYVQFEFSVGT